MNEALKAKIERDASTAEREAKNCLECDSLASIKECRNSMRGYCAVVAKYPDGLPYLRFRECVINRKFKLQHKINTMRAESNLGERFWGRTFDTFQINDDNRAAFEAVNAYADTFVDSRRWLILAGPVGTGKTHLAVAVLNAAIEQGVQPYFIPAPDMIRKLGASYQDDSTMEYLWMLQGSELLVLDDAGKEMTQEKNKEFMFQLLNNRYEGDRPTVITTNLSPNDLIGRYGDAVASRLREVADLVIVDGADYRLK